MTERLIYLQIENEDPINIYTAYDLFLISSSNISGFEPKDAFTYEFAEEHGERYIPSDKYKAFNYHIELGYFVDRANDSSLPYNNYNVNTFIESLQNKQITIYNNLKKNKIVGYLKSVDTTNIERLTNSSLKDLCTFRLVFRVNNPSLCDLNYVES